MQHGDGVFLQLLAGNDGSGLGDELTRLAAEGERHEMQVGVLVGFEDDFKVRVGEVGGCRCVEVSRTADAKLVVGLHVLQQEVAVLVGEGDAALFRHIDDRIGYGLSFGVDDASLQDLCVLCPGGRSGKRGKDGGCQQVFAESGKQGIHGMLVYVCSHNLSSASCPIPGCWGAWVLSMSRLRGWDINTSFLQIRVVGRSCGWQCRRRTH